jgi:hypothetical protein
MKALIKVVTYLFLLIVVICLPIAWFVLLCFKLVGVLEWPWWQVNLPIFVALYEVIQILLMASVAKTVMEE